MKHGDLNWQLLQSQSWKSDNYIGSTKEKLKNLRVDQKIFCISGAPITFSWNVPTI